METLRQECYTGGIAVDAVQADGCIAGRVAQEVYTLISVCKNATSHHGLRGSGQHKTGQHTFCCFHFR